MTMIMRGIILSSVAIKSVRFMPQSSNSLTRSLTLPSAVMLGLGSIFGTGVFVSIGIAAGITGPSVILAIIVAAMLATCNALSSAQLAASHPVSGGTYEYGYRMIGPKTGFAAGWLFLLAKSASAATAALGTIGYGAHLLGANIGQSLPFLACGLVIVVTALVVSGLRRSNITNSLIVGITLVSLIAFIVFALIQIEEIQFGNLTPFFAQGSDSGMSFFYAAALMFVAFTGYGRIATMGEEVKDPKRTIPKAIIVTLVVSTLIYISVAYAAVLSVGAEALSPERSGSAAPLEIAALQMQSPILAKVISIGAVTAMLGVLLNLILGLSRVALAMGRRGDLPKQTSVVNSAGNPVVAIVAVGIFIALLTLIGDIKLVWSFSAFTVLAYYSITNLSALRQPEEERLYPRFITVMGLLGCLSLAAFIPIGVMGAGLVMLAIGLIGHSLKHK